MPIQYFHTLPSNLQDVVIRIGLGQTVYGFELELLASFVSQ